MNDKPKKWKNSAYKLQDFSLKDKSQFTLELISTVLLNWLFN